MSANVIADLGSSRSNIGIFVMTKIYGRFSVSFLFNKKSVYHQRKPARCNNKPFMLLLLLQQVVESGPAAAVHLSSDPLNSAAHVSRSGVPHRSDGGRVSSHRHRPAAYQ